MRHNTIAIPDARDRGASLRVTRHPEQHKVVLSHWRDRICVASTPIELGEVPALIGILVDALAEGREAAPAPRADPGVGGFRGIRSMIRQWLRPRLAQIADIRTPWSGGERKVS